MRKLLPARSLASLALLFALAQAAAAQVTAPVDTRGALAALPDSQGVLFVNVRRIVNEMLPKIMPPAEYQKMLSEAQKVGFDARGVEYAAVAIRLVDPPPANGLPEFVVVIKGNFNADTLLSLGRVVAGAKNVKTRSETYGSKTLEIIDLEALNKPTESPDPNAPAAEGGGGSGPKPKPMPYPEVAVMALDSSTLVAGVPAYVRAAVDSSGGQGALKASMLELAAHDPQALWSLTAELPPSLAQYLRKTGMPANAEAEQMISWVKQLSVAQGMDALNYTLSASVLTDAPEHASAFSGLVRMGLLAAQTGLSAEAAKQTPRHKDYAKTQAALSAVKSFVNRTDGSTLHLSVSVPQKMVAQFVRQEMTKKPTSTTTAKPTRRRGRARK